jgi:vacuolar-type H+-ATPase subunit E/Vma4
MSNMFLNIVSTFKNDGIKQATDQLGGFGRTVGGFGITLGKIGAALAAFGVVSKSIEFGREAITSARDLERNLFGLEAVFGEITPQMVAFTKNAEEMGLSQSAAAQASTFIGSVLKQSGFAMHDVAIETQKLTSLATDLSVVYGYDVQEALLGMTALFRGEYDPIEKFGVAMKQSEVNARLAGDEFKNLTGGQRRLAEQQVRLQMLYERSTDSLGAFADQTGSLFVEQKKLGASFENFKAQLGNALIPAVAEMNTAFRETLDDIFPALINIIGFVAQVITGLVNIIRDLSDPTTDLGEKFYELGARIESLYETIFRSAFDIAQVFDLISWALQTVTGYAQNFLLVIEDVLDIIAVLAEMTVVLVKGGPGAFFATDWAERFREELIENRENIRVTAEVIDEYNDSLAGLFAGMGGSILDGLFDSPGGGGSGKITGLQAWLNKAAEDMEVAALRIKLIAAGLGEAVVDSLLASGDAVKTGIEALALIARRGLAGISQLTTAYLGTAKAQAEAARQAAAAAEEARRREQEIINKREAAYKSFADSVKETFGAIKESILSSFSLPDLGNSVNSISRNIQKLLTRTREFAKNITSLSQQGLNETLLQQVIGAGPMEGGKLAAALAGAGGGFISELNQAYGEFGGLASGIAGVGTGAAFANQSVVNNYYEIEVSGGVGSGPSIGKAIVDAIKSYERTSGAVWQGAN